LVYMGICFALWGYLEDCFMVRAFLAFAFTWMLFGFGYVLHARVPEMAPEVQVALGLMVALMVLLMQAVLVTGNRLECGLMWTISLLCGYGCSWLRGVDAVMAPAGAVMALGFGLGCAVVVALQVFCDEREGVRLMPYDGNPY
jgi:hypothetical protein